MSNRDTIIEEAKKLFRHKGYSAVSMNDVVSNTGVTKPTIYHYFGDKEGLYTEVLIAMLASGANYTAPTFAKPLHFKDKLIKLAVGYFENSPTAVSTLLRDSSVHLSEANIKRVNEAMQFYMFSPFEQVFQLAIKDGEISSDKKSDDLALVFITYLDTFTALHRHQHGRSKNYNDTAKMAITLLFEGIERT